MTVTAIEKRQEPAAMSMKGLESALLDADLGKMSEPQRIQYYSKVCESLGLNPLTQPFEYIRLNGKLVLYARRSCTEQLRKLHGISVEITSRTKVDGLYVVTAKATDRDGRVDESIGAVPIDKLQGENLSNALMKAETKAKRRVTLAICGLAFLDESEAESVRPQREQLPAKTPQERMDEIAARGGERAETRPTSAATTADSAGQLPSSPETSTGNTAESASKMPSSEPSSSNSLGSGATGDGELLDAKAWRKRYETVCEAAMQISNVIFGSEDEHGLPIPPFDVPVISAQAKKFAGMTYEEVDTGFVRKVIVGDKRFGDQPLAKQLWALYVVVRNELEKEKKANEQSA